MLTFLKLGFKRMLKIRLSKEEIITLIMVALFFSTLYFKHKFDMLEERHVDQTARFERLQKEKELHLKYKAVEDIILYENIIYKDEVTTTAHEEQLEFRAEIQQIDREEKTEDVILNVREDKRDIETLYPNSETRVNTLSDRKLTAVVNRMHNAYCRAASDALVCDTK